MFCALETSINTFNQTTKQQIQAIDREEGPMNAEAEAESRTRRSELENEMYMAQSEMDTFNRWIESTRNAMSGRNPIRENQFFSMRTKYKHAILASYVQLPEEVEARDFIIASYCQRVQRTPPPRPAPSRPAPPLNSARDRKTSSAAQGFE